MIKLLFPISSKFCLLPIRHQWLGSQDFGNRPTACSKQNTLSPYAEGVPAERNSAHIDNYLDKLMPMVKCWENSKTGPCHWTQHLRWACQRGLCEEVTTESRPQSQEAALGGDRPQASGSPAPSFFCFRVTGLLQAWGAQVAVSEGLMFAVLLPGQESPRKGPGWTTHLSWPLNSQPLLS